MTQQKTLMTADEFFEFCGRNGGRFALIRGEVIELSPVNDEHSGISINIGTALTSTLDRSASGKREWKRGNIALQAGHRART